MIGNKVVDVVDVVVVDGGNAVGKDDAALWVGRKGVDPRRRRWKQTQQVPDILLDKCKVASYVTRLLWHLRHRVGRPSRLRLSGTQARSHKHRARRCERHGRRAVQLLSQALRRAESAGKGIKKKSVRVRACACVCKRMRSATAHMPCMYSTWVECVCVRLCLPYARTTGGAFLSDRPKVYYAPYPVGALFAGIYHVRKTMRVRRRLQHA